MKKKILALMLLTVTFFACTTEDSGTKSDSDIVTKNTSGNATIDGLYNVMINSPQHIAYKKAQKAFIGKMKFTGNINQITTSAKIITWIGQNLARTNFTSVSAAQAELNNVKSLFNTSAAANMGFFNAISAQTNPGYMWGELRTTSWPIYNPCLCLGGYISAMAGNAAVGQAAVNAACEQISAGNPNGLSMGADALNAWDCADEEALDAYNACIAACGN